MKRTYVVAALALSLTGCYGTSCDDTYEYTALEYQSFATIWVPGDVSNWSLDLAQRSELPAGIYAPDDVALVIAGELAYQVAAARPVLRFNLFSTAHACEPVFPEFDAPIVSLDIAVATSTAADVVPGMDARAWFDVKASFKAPGERLSLEEWNGLPAKTGYSYPPGSYVTAVLSFNNKLMFDEGTITFSVIATLKDGSLFEFETQPLQLSGS